MPTIRNAAPKHYALGTEDKSTRVVYPKPEAIPQHLPKFFLLTEKGPMEPTLVSGPRLLKIFGDKTLDPNSKFYNHASLFTSRVLGEANNVMVQRVVDPTARQAGFTIYADILEGSIPNYERHSDGSIVIDILGQPVICASGDDADNNNIDDNTDKAVGETFEGNFLTYVVGPIIDDNDSGSIPGTMNDGTNQSTMYPILTVRADNVGSYYNDIGITLSAPMNDDVNQSFIKESSCYPYRISLINKEFGTNEKINTIYGEKYVDFISSTEKLHPLTEKKCDIKTIVSNRWSNLDDPLMPLVYPDLDPVFVFEDNMKYIETKVYEAEICKLIPNTIVDGDNNTYTRQDFTDFELDSEENQTACSNIMTFKNSNGVPYFGTVGVVDGITQTIPPLFSKITLSKNTPIFLSGGSDGAVDNATYEEAVIRSLSDYLDTESRVMDMAINVESVVYDSGFTLDAKKELCNFVALRKDTFIALSTYEYTKDKHVPVSIAEESAVGAILKNKLKLMPESDYFGTPVMRGCIVMGSGMLADDTHPYRVPQLLEIAVKASRYMGAGNGKWKSGFSFDRFPGNVVSVLKGLDPDFIPEGTKNKLWSNGLIWTQPLDRRQYHIPAKQTVYENDTSVLNSFEVALAICTLNKINADAWRRFTGSVGLSNAELAEEVIAYVESRVLRIFDGLFTIIPKVVITEADEQRGYSWHLIVEIYINNMKSVMVHNIAAYRASDLTN